MSIADFTGKEIAIVAVSKRGAELGRRLKGMLPGSHLYLSEKFALEKQKDEYPFPLPAKEVVRKVFVQYRYLVLIMAVGIAVRLVANELRDKHKDPGIVAVDDSGTFAVSLLSGHIGEANDLTRKIASLLGAQPVVTTASDASHTIPVDLLGKEFGWIIEDETSVKAASAALVNGEPVGIYQDAGERNWWSETVPLPDNVSIYNSLEALYKSSSQAALVITDRIMYEEQQQLLSHHTVIYRPKSLVVGIGCNRGTRCSEIEEAVVQAFNEHELSTKSIRNIATIDLKKDEAGLLEFAQKYGLPIEYFTKDTLRKVDFPSRPSAMVLEHVGTPAVCESAAILSSGNGSLIAPKMSFRGAVTIAVARLSFNSVETRRSGKLYLVGLGPGAQEQMTFRAREALNKSEVIVGYRTYIKLIAPLTQGKEIIATGMGEEIQRAKTAVSLARKGKVVSIVCSGDSGVYGMAGLVGEILCKQEKDWLDIEVIPGVPALVASAALLGAPLTGDFASISLSDYLVTWEDIAKRLRLAAQGDFVIVIYNPKSKNRQHQLSKAREIILQDRAPNTPVGIVINAYRQGQQVVITDLEHMLDYEIDMNTTIIIGNSSTFFFNNWMVTSRGYPKKYSLTGESHL